MRTCFCCRRCHAEKRTWSSSRVFGARYLLNQKLVCMFFIFNFEHDFNRRMVHSFTSAGILPTQYMKLSMFAGIGVVKHGYMSKGIYWTYFCPSLLHESA